MIGSPDVLAFTSEGSLGLGDGGYLDPQALPEEFSLPLLPPSNPWSSPSAFNRDFVLVAEFSEQVGPIPVKTIPDDPRVIGSFDLNHFSLRIMSVDYQATAPAPQPHPQTAGPSPQPTGPSPQPHPCLAVSEDSCVVLGDSKEGAFAYVHHLTLYDLEARGFVRPFCMAYVSHDQSKIMQHFQELSMLFSRASECLKTGNRRAFANELQRKLQDLEYTRSILQKEVELQTTANQSAEIREDVEPQKTANELANVDRSILDHRSLLRQVTSYPNRKIQDPGFLPYEPSPTSESLPMTPDPPSPSYTPQLVSGVSLGGGGWSAKRFDRRLKPLDELSDAYFLSLTMEQLTNAECRLRGDQSVLHTRRVTHTLSRKLSHTHFLFQLWDQEDNELDEEEGVGLEGGGTADWPGARTPRPESFMSCVEEVSIKLETGEGPVLTSDPKGEEVTMETRPGSVSSGESIEVLGTERSYRTQGLRDTEFRGEPADVWGQSDCAGVGRWHTEAGMRRGLRSPARRTNSEDSIEVISTTDSIFPDDLIFTAIKEEEPELHSIMGSGVQGKDLDETNAGPHGTLGIEVQEMEENVSERLDTLSPMPQLQDTLVQQGAVEGSSQLDQGFHANGFVRGQGGCGSRRGLVPDLQVNFALPLRLEVKGQGSEERWLHGDNSCNLNVDEASDCISYNSTSPSSSEPPSLPPPHLHGVHSARNPRWRQHQRRKAALEALRFLRQFSFYQNAVFCLLTGRPLVVIGGDERLVRKTVSALSLYLPSPGCYGDAVQPYLATPLQLTDLVIWRLIGIHRTSSPTTPSMLHSLARYRRYLAVLDLDQKTLRSPAYQGHLIGRLADPRALIGHGSTYLLHLESCLMELTAKAFFYTFYTVSLYSSTPDPSPVVAGGGQTPPICKAPPALQCPSIPRGRGSMLTQHCRNFLCGRGFSEEDDFCVLHFLSDLIKQRHTGSGPPPLCFSYSPTPLHRNTTT